MTISNTFAEHMKVASEAAATLPRTIERIVAAVVSRLRSGNKVLACGNGGSAADAQHLVAELVGRFRHERGALAAMSLLGDAPALTAIANDYGFEHVFARQIEALARAGDLLFAITTSGNSQNVVLAAEAARRLGCCVVAFTGEDSGRVAMHADLVLAVPSRSVARVQEVHTLAIHAIAEALDTEMRDAETRT
jgi:D-sedoheptulose 7-phosphate isomerase